MDKLDQFGEEKFFIDYSGDNVGILELWLNNHMIIHFLYYIILNSIVYNVK